jgi:hypothetical protein
MKAILTTKGARRIARPNMANREVEVTDLRTMPWGTRNATVIIDGVIVARGMHVYTEGANNENYALMLTGK